MGRSTSTAAQQPINQNLKVTTNEETLTNMEISNEETQKKTRARGNKEAATSG
jgi:hypothetical protein